MIERSAPAGIGISPAQQWMRDHAITLPTRRRPNIRARRLVLELLVAVDIAVLIIIAALLLWGAR